MYKKILLLFSVFPLIAGIFGMFINISKSIEFEQGEIVVTEIIQKPRDCKSLGNRYSFIKLKYEDRIFLKRVNKDFCPLLGQGTINMVINEKKNNVYFLKGENFGGQIFFSFIIFIVGVICIFRVLKKDKSW